MFTFNYKRNDKAKVTENPKLSFNSKRNLVTLRYIAVNPFSALGVFLIHREPMIVLFFQKLRHVPPRDTLRVSRETNKEIEAFV